MEKRCASILLMLSLEALLVVAGISEAAVSGNVDTIRLPSDVKTGDERMWSAHIRSIIFVLVLFFRILLAREVQY
uniref:Uncharacterized protein n=1 Tax=Arundo donax TaxID=35708 RepID=A0A0A9H9Y9_ARUDO